MLLGSGFLRQVTCLGVQFAEVFGTTKLVADVFYSQHPFALAITKWETKGGKITKDHGRPRQEVTCMCVIF